MSSLIVFPAAIFLEGKTQGLHAEGCIFCTDNRYISSIHQQIHSHGITLILDEEHHKMRDSKTTPPPHPPPKEHGMSQVLIIIHLTVVYGLG